jgi:cation diffusion facilitator family transporter
MAHFRRPLAAAAALNGAIFVVEGLAGYQANSLSLLMDSVHNLSDQAALVMLYLALVLPLGLSRGLQRSANLFNSVGLIAVSALLLWQAVEHILAPAPVASAVPIVVGLAAAVGNWGVARLLREPARNNAAMRLAYLHNLGDMWVSLAPVLAGVLLATTSYAVFDPLVAAAVAVWIIATTLREVVSSRDQLVWPEKFECSHAPSSAPDAPPVT